MPGPAFSPEVITKAERYLDEDRVRAAGNDVFLVQGSARQPYRVQTDANPVTRQVTWALCSCPHGANNGGPKLPKCSHVVAVLIVIRDGLEIPKKGVAWGQPRPKPRRRLSVVPDASGAEDTGTGL